MNGLVHLILEKLERWHGKILVAHALSCILINEPQQFVSMMSDITCAKRGLTASELEDLLSCDDEVLNDVYQWCEHFYSTEHTYLLHRWTPPQRRLPPMLWIRIKNDLNRYLVERGSDRSTVYAW